jgi:hypothetical protein
MSVVDDMSVNSVCAVSHIAGLTDVQQHKMLLLVLCECLTDMGCLLCLLVALFPAILIMVNKFLRHISQKDDIVSMSTDVSGRLWIRYAAFDRYWIKV